MAYPPKIELALEVLARTSISRSSYAPLLHRLLWSIGVPLRPPHFNTFWGNFLEQSGWSIVVSPLVLWLISNQSVGSILIQGVAFAVISGLTSAAWVHQAARKNDIPDWSDLDVANRFD